MGLRREGAPRPGAFADERTSGERPLVSASLEHACVGQGTEAEFATALLRESLAPLLAAVIESGDTAKLRPLVAMLGGLPAPLPRLASVALGSVLESALRAVEPASRHRYVAWEVEGDVPWVVLADASGLGLILAAMARSVLRAACVGATIAVVAYEHDGAVSVDMRADADCPTLSSVDAVPPWACPDDTVRGLALAERIAHAHGFRLEDLSTSDRRALRLTLPHRSLVSRPRRA